MAIDFSKLKKTNNFQKLQENLKKGERKGFEKDTRFWKLKANDDKKANAVIRFLPIPFIDYEKVEAGTFSDDLLTPAISVKKHSFQGANGWYIENCLSTIGIGQEDVVYLHDGPLWKECKENEDKAQKEVLKKRIAREYTYCNILVIKDPANRENEGKVFLYDIPVSVMKLIKAQAEPEFDDVDPRDAFDPINGMNFKMRLTYEEKKINGKEILSPNFSNCEWDSTSALFDGDEDEITNLWKKEYSLLEFINPTQYKSAEVLTEKLLKVLGEEPGTVKTAGSSISKEASSFFEEETPSKESEKVLESSSNSDTSDDLSEFEELLNS